MQERRLICYWNGWALQVTVRGTQSHRIRGPFDFISRIASRLTDDPSPNWYRNFARGQKGQFICGSSPLLRTYTLFHSLTGQRELDGVTPQCTNQSSLCRRLQASASEALQGHSLHRARSIE